MKYMMLINLGPKARDWTQLTEEERGALQAGFQALNETPGVTPGIGLAPRRFRGSHELEHDCAATTANAEHGTPPNNKWRRRAADPVSAPRSRGKSAPQHHDDSQPVSPPAPLPCPSQG